MKEKLWMYFCYTLCTVLLGCQEWQQHECTCIHDNNITAIVSQIPKSLATYHPIQTQEPMYIRQGHPSSFTSPIKSISSKLRTISGSPLKPVQETDGTNNECVDINMDDLNKLTKLPGIGPGKAKSIIQAREKRPFKRKKDITRVKGIGIQTYKKLSDQICDIPSRQ